MGKNNKIIGRLKLQKPLWPKIETREKFIEFRKMEKGYVSGLYEFTSIEMKQQTGVDWCDRCVDSGAKTPCGITYRTLGLWHKRNNHSTSESQKCGDVGVFVDTEPVEIFGSAYLTPKYINPVFNEDRGWPAMETRDGVYMLDRLTYDFVMNNYIKKGIDFIAYEISEVISYD